MEAGQAEITALGSVYSILDISYFVFIISSSESNKLGKAL